MKTIYLGSFATLVNKKSEKSLINAIKDILDDNNFGAIWYSFIRNGVKQFIINHFDKNILDNLLYNLSLAKPEKPSQIKNRDISREAVQLMKTISYDLFEGKDMSEPPEKSISFHGIELNINPNAIITWQDVDGATHVGAIKTKIKKTALRLEEATMIACMLQYYLTVFYPDYIVEPDYCICFDVFRRKFITSKNYSMNVVRAASIADKIASMGEVAA